MKTRKRIKFEDRKIQARVLAALNKYGAKIEHLSDDYIEIVIPNTVWIYVGYDTINPVLTANITYSMPHTPVSIETARIEANKILMATDLAEALLTVMNSE